MHLDAIPVYVIGMQVLPLSAVSVDPAAMLACACAQGKGKLAEARVREPPVRYTVVEVQESCSEKLLRAVDTGCGREVAVHLRDGWAGTPAQPGDIVHVLAPVDVVDGHAHATCDHASGEPPLPDTCAASLPPPLNHTLHTTHYPLPCITCV